MTKESRLVKYLKVLKPKEQPKVIPLKTTVVSSREFKLLKHPQYRMYKEYMDSPMWKAKREKAFTFHGRKCKHCKSTKLLQVHHKTYVNLFKEKMEDLIILCKSCHEKEHVRLQELKDKRKRQ